MISGFFLLNITQAKDNKNSTINEIPPVCSSTPESMQLYLDFQKDALNLIQGNPFPIEVASIWELEPGLFSNKLLELEGDFKNSTIANLYKHIDLSVKRLTMNTVVTSVLFLTSSISTASNLTVGFAILFQERPIVRDRAKLMDAEREVSKTIYYLGRQGILDKNISDTSLFQQLIDSYIQKGLFADNSHFSEWVKYRDFATFLATQNVKMKYFLLYKGQNSLRATEKIEEGNEKQEEHFGIFFNPEWVDQLNDDYLGMRFGLGFKCNRSFWGFAANIKGSFKNLWEGTVSARKIIKQASIELGQAFALIPQGIGANLAGQDKQPYLTAREKELLRNVYGLDTRRMTKETTFSILNISKQTKNRLTDMQKSLINPTWKYVIKPISKKVSDTTKNIFKKSEKKIKNQKTQEATKKELSSKVSDDMLESMAAALFVESPKATLTKFKDDYADLVPAKEDFNLAMLWGLQRLVKEQEIDKNLNQIGLPAEITYKFWELSNSIKRIIFSVGNKEHGLRQSLNLVCSYQASNKGSQGCYVQ